MCVCVQAFLKLAKTPLIKHSDMVEEMRVEAVEISVSGTYVYVSLIQESRAHVPPSLSHANDACIAARSREERWGVEGIALHQFPQSLLQETDMPILPPSVTTRNHDLLCARVCVCVCASVYVQRSKSIARTSRNAAGSLKTTWTGSSARPGTASLVSSLGSRLRTK